MPDKVEQKATPVEKKARMTGTGTGQTQALGINPWYLSDEFTDSYRKAFTDKHLGPPMFSIKQGEEPMDGEGIIISSPFHTGKLRSILPNKFLLGLKHELSELNWHERLNDLYWFHQTDDLALNGKKHIKMLRDYLSGEEFVGFMEKITGTELVRGYLDLAAQRYKKGNHLLCHDDDVHRGKMTRKIAYIIYLVDEEWSEEDGGALGLFDSDDSRYPTKVVSHIVPEFNSIGFFLTGMVSYHTVEEVTVADQKRERWSVTGWFYGPATENNTTEENTLQILPSSVLPQVSPLEHLVDTKDDQTQWAKWINPDYLKAAVQVQIQDTFMEQSSVELHNFLHPKAFQSILSCLSQEFWHSASLKGPAHLRSYLEKESLASDTDIRELAGFLRSDSFGRFLASVTSLQLVDASQQVRRFNKGHYTLIHDQALEPAGLDVTLSLMPPVPKEDPHAEWDESWGGATHYVADKDELLRISPDSNSLSLVLRDEGTLRFVKYLNHMAPRDIQEISMVFTEQNEDE
ncbi:putative component of NuA3 histone acetyltransferase complex [Coemansia sp. RSA 1722]|nr:putative component of NuA3 histone acetyltransferase complex [Coemansia sp. RSA 485]KAJ2596521.1 putative component of NuA3 histone acetyltransferase complex [Coemansia sp. RSA 1722]